MPADLHSSIAAGTRGLGGSIKEIKPQKIKLFISKLNLETHEALKINFFSGNLSLGKWNRANPKTLSPFLPN